MEYDKHANSTGSRDITRSLVAVNLKSIIRAVATILQAQIAEDQNLNEEAVTCPDIEYFNEEKYIKARAEDFNQENYMLLKTSPTTDQIYDFIKAIYDYGQMSPECSIVCLVYINRLIAFTGMRLKPTNWRPLILCCLLAAQKVCDDKEISNFDVAYMYPFFSVTEIDVLQKKFLELIQNNVFVKAAIYTQYYYELKTLCEDKPDFLLSPLDITAAKKLEARSEQLKNEMEKARKDGILFKRSMQPELVTMFD